MAKIIGNINSPVGTVLFSMCGEKLDIRTSFRNFLVTDDEIQEKDGKFFFDVSKQHMEKGLKEIEIPKVVIERKNRILIDNKHREKSIASLEHTEGTVFFSLTEDGHLICSFGEKEIITEGLLTIEGKRCIEGYKLGLASYYFEVPADTAEIITATQTEKKTNLVFAGIGPLTGKTYFKFNSSVSPAAWDQVKKYFSEFNESGDFGELKGWLTSEPAKVEEILNLKNTVFSRETEIKKQIEKTQKKHEGIKRKMN